MIVLPIRYVLYSNIKMGWYDSTDHRESNDSKKNNYIF